MLIVQHVCGLMPPTHCKALNHNSSSSATCIKKVLIFHRCLAGTLLIHGKTNNGVVGADLLEKNYLHCFWLSAESQNFRHSWLCPNTMLHSQLSNNVIID